MVITWHVTLFCTAHIQSDDDGDKGSDKTDDLGGDNIEYLPAYC